jgi:hypothetical protein
MKIFISGFKVKKEELSRNNATLIFCNLYESRLSEIEVLKWYISPTTIVVGQICVWSEI